MDWPLTDSTLNQHDPFSITTTDDGDEEHYVEVYNVWKGQELMGPPFERLENALKEIERLRLEQEL